MIAISCEGFQQILAQYLQLFKSTAKLNYITSSIFVGLLKEGFCTEEETQDGDGQAEAGENFQEAEGTVSIIILTTSLL